MSKSTGIQRIVDSFVRAALDREITTGKAWDYGWSQASYRRSSTAAMSHDRHKRVRLHVAGIDSFEEATTTLLAFQQVQQRYDVDEFCELTASLVGTLPLKADLDQLSSIISRWIDKILAPVNSVVVFAVANVARLENVLSLGPLVVGRLDHRFKQLVQVKAERAVLERQIHDLWWMSDSVENGPDQSSPVVLAYAGQSQLELAINKAREAFEDLISIALMMQPDLDALSLFSLRGDANRPGLRGLVVDREALTKLAETAPAISKEIGCQVLVDGVLGERTTLHWYSEDPFPLEKMLDDSEKQTIADRLLLASSAIDRRLRVAARWHAKAHWSAELADAVLALGISFDSMLSEQGPTPGRALSERFALLDPDADGRRRRYHQFQTEYYPARSSVAHGAKRESLDAAFVRDMAKQVRWTFQRILKLTRLFGTSSEHEYQEMWESLRWNGPSACPS
jgi:hypothetical protein